MTTAYPGSIDNFTNPTSTDALDAPGVEHDLQHANANDAIEAVETALGIDPAGTYADVATRLAAGGLRVVATRVVAASNADAKTKAAADYVCDGVDDHVEIQAAIDSLPANVGGLVYLSEGTFFIGATVTLETPGVTIRGAGRGSPRKFNKRGGTRLAYQTGLTTTMLRVSAGSNTSNNTWVNLENFGVDGYDDAGNRGGTSIVGIHWRAQTSRIDNVSIYGMSGDGLHAEGFTGSQTLDCTYTSILCRDNGGYGVNADSFSGDGQWDHLVCSQNALGGFYNAGASNQIENCHFYSNDGWGFITETAAARVKLLGTKMEHNAGGAWLKGSQAIVSNCSFADNAVAATSTPTLQVDGGTNLIATNQIRKDTGDGVGDDLGVEVTGSNNLFVGNYFNGFTTSMTDTGTGNEGRSNFGVADF